MRRAIAAVLLALAAAACSGGGGQEAKPYSAVDLGWIKRLNRWDERYERQGTDIQPVYIRALETRGDLGPLREVLRPYRECTRSLRAKVGEPEHEQLRRAYGFLLEACDKDQRFARALLRSASPNPGYPSADQFRASDFPFHEAFQAVGTGLIANRSLPVRGGQTDESRIEPRLSQAASTLTRQEIEVRCWSAEDWPRMNKEYNAYSGDRGDPAGFVTGATRAHIFPAYCETLARFLYDHWRPADDVGLDDLAEAVGLVAHETEHLFETGIGEAETECHAAQDVRQLARLLGASSSYASRLATVYWRDVYPPQPPDYRSKECRNGGAFDRHPETDAFP
jgi:hypothetical protein